MSFRVREARTVRGIRRRPYAVGLLRQLGQQAFFPGCPMTATWPAHAVIQTQIRRPGHQVRRLPLLGRPDSRRDSQ